MFSSTYLLPTLDPLILVFQLLPLDENYPFGPYQFDHAGRYSAFVVKLDLGHDEMLFLSGRLFSCLYQFG